MLSKEELSHVKEYHFNIETLVAPHLSDSAKSWLTKQLDTLQRLVLVIDVLDIFILQSIIGNNINYFKMDIKL